MKRVIKLTESQLAKLTESRIKEVSTVELASALKELPCTGEGVKELINKKLMEYGFEDVNIKFLGYGKNKKRLKYIIHTEGPIFVVKTRSNTDLELPCMEVFDVVAYVKV